MEYMTTRTPKIGDSVALTMGKRDGVHCTTDATKLFDRIAGFTGLLSASPTCVSSGGNAAWKIL